jgi:integrase
LIPAKILTSPFRRGSISSISLEGVDEMTGGVYRYGKDGWRIRFKGDWFIRDENGKPFRAQFYALSFLNLLNGLYDPDPAKNRYDRSRFKSKTPYKFDEAFELYLDRRETDSSWRQAKRYTFQKYFMPYFANCDFRTIDDIQVQSFARDLEKKGLKGKTIKNIIGILFGFLNYFKRAINCLPERPSISYQTPKIRWFTEKEIDQVFEFIKVEDLGYFLFIRYYGVRPEEASGLLKSAINWETREITISKVYVDGKMKPRTKTKTERMLPMIPEIEEHLKKAWIPGQARNDKPNNSIFIFSVKGQPYTRHIRERRWNKAMVQAVQKYSTRGMTLRDLRHSAATSWRRRGVPLDLISRILGHSDLRVTDKFYADVSTHELISIVRGK